MEEERYINAINKLARATGLSAYAAHDVGDPDSISVLLEVPGADSHVELCSFQTKRVVEWVDNGEDEGKQHIISRIEAAKDRLRHYYCDNR